MTIGIVALVLVPSAAALLARVIYNRHSRSAPHGFRRVTSVLDVATREWGTLIPAVTLLFTGVTAIIAIEWLAGLGAHAVQDVVDWPIFRWTQAHQNAGWTATWWKLTQIGSPTVTQRLAVVAAIVLGLLWRRRLWWLPGASLATAYVVEKYGQIVLKLVVHRGHPPTTMGTWPSGGCARVLVIYGLIAYFLARNYRGGRSRGAWVLAASAAALALTIQAYARLNNLEHWFTDVLGGTAYGALLLALMVAVAEVVQRGRRLNGDRGSGLPRTRRSRREKSHAVMDRPPVRQG
jgi:hypothetical protein